MFADTKMYRVTKDSIDLNHLQSDIDNLVHCSTTSQLLFKFVPWNIRSHGGTFVLGTIRSLDCSFPGTFRSRE